MLINSTLASQGYSQALAVARPDSDAASRSPAAAFSTAAGDFLTTLRAGEETMKAGLVGRADAHSVVQAIAQTEIAVQTAVAVRDRVVEAYQEILRMPV